MLYWKAPTGDYVASETDPSNWVAKYISVSKDEYDKWYIKDKIEKGGRSGTLIDNIVVWHSAISETLIKHMDWLPLNQLAEKQRLKIVADTVVRYNLELANKDVNPDYVIPARDKGVLGTALQAVKEYDSKTYELLASIVHLDGSALHNEIVDAYMLVFNTLHGHDTSTTGENIAAGGLNG